jgi:Uma2 family endonuclease
MSALYGIAMRMEAAESLIVKNRARWTRAQFDRLVELGAFDGGERVELVRGELVTMSRQGVPHGNVIETLNEILMPRLVGKARVRVQLPFVIDDESELIPDLAIVDRSLPRSEHPASAFLIIEVADSSLRYDRIVKAPLYASAGVPEYWLVDTSREHVERFMGLRRGAYTRTTKVSTGALAVPGFPGLEVPVADLFR